MRYLITLLLTFTFYTYADDHGSEADVLAAVEKYYAARTARDFKTMVAMESNAGVCSTNSDGSFHKECTVFTVEDYERTYPDGLDIAVFTFSLLKIIEVSLKFWEYTISLILSIDVVDAESEINISPIM